MDERTKVEKMQLEQQKIDPNKIKQIEIEKKIQSPIDRRKIEQIEQEKEKSKNKPNK